MSDKKEPLDLSGLLCPMPVIKTQNAIKSLTPGDTLTVVCTDPGTLHDIPAWCRMYGHRLLSATEEGEEITFCIEVVVDEGNGEEDDSEADSGTDSDSDKDSW